MKHTKKDTEKIHLNARRDESAFVVGVQYKYMFGNKMKSEIRPNEEGVINVENWTTLFFLSVCVCACAFVCALWLLLFIAE